MRKEPSWGSDRTKPARGSFTDTRLVRFAMIAAPRFFSPERKIEGVVTHLLENYRDVLHVRRVVSWLGLVVLGIEKVAGPHWWPSSARRSIYFRHQGRTYKVKFDHKGGRGGGLVFVELSGRGTRSPERATVLAIKSLEEAESFYLRAPSYFRRDDDRPIAGDAPAPPNGGDLY